MLARLRGYLDRFSPNQLRKNVVKVGPHLSKLSGFAQDALTHLGLHCELTYDVHV